MNPRLGYFESLLAGLALTLFAYVVLSVAIDPLRVFGLSHFDRKNFEPDTRYLQIRHLRRDPVPNAFVLGSSRVNFYDVRELDRLTGLRYYNLSASIEGFDGIARKVAWLVSQRPVAAVLIGLDYDLYDVREDRTDLQHVDPPEISGEWPVEFYARALLIPPPLLRDCIVGNLISRTGYRFDEQTGQYWVPGGAFAPGDHLVDRERRPPSAALAELSATLELLKAHHVAYQLVVPPYSERRLLQFDPAGYTAWLRAVVALSGGLWDFGDDNSVARDIGNYLDISHFDSRVGRWTLERIYGRAGGRSGLPRDLGVWVTPANVDAHLRAIRLALAAARMRANTVARRPDDSGSPSD